MILYPAKNEQPLKCIGMLNVYPYDCYNLWNRKTFLTTDEDILTSI